ncbi:MAG: acyl dehydratase [Gammaproteobacteria bacterium]
MSRPLFGDWRVGEELQPLAFPVTRTAIVASAFATRDYSLLHHDEHYAREQAGLPGIFLNSPAIQALFGRFLGERFGPRARLARLRVALQASVHAGVCATVSGHVTVLSVDALGRGWAEVAMTLGDGERCCVRAAARLAIPVDGSDDPWQREAEDWQP